MAHLRYHAPPLPRARGEPSSTNVSMEPFVSVSRTRQMAADVRGGAQEDRGGGADTRRCGAPPVPRAAAPASAWWAIRSECLNGTIRAPRPAKPKERVRGQRSSARCCTGASLTMTSDAADGGGCAQRSARSSCNVGGAALALCVHEPAPADGRCAPVDASTWRCGGGGRRARRGRCAAPGARRGRGG